MSQSLHNLGMTLISVGRFEEALAIQEENIEFNKAMLPDNAEQNASALSAMVRAPTCTPCHRIPQLVQTF